MECRLVSFGEIEIDGERFEHDVVIERGRIRKRKKGPSKRYRAEFGHTPADCGREGAVVGDSAYRGDGRQWPASGHGRPLPGGRGPRGGGGRAADGGGVRVARGGRFEVGGGNSACDVLRQRDDRSVTWGRVWPRSGTDVGRETSLLAVGAVFRERNPPLRARFGYP
jgi:hypothetical protein